MIYVVGDGGCVAEVHEARAGKMDDVIGGEVLVYYYF